MRQLPKVFLPAIATSLLLAACGGSSSKTASSATGEGAASQTSSSPSSMSAAVKMASNATLGTILVNGQGMTLYHLSGESANKFICTSSACVGVWHPLTAPSSGAPSGEVGSLAVVKRPDGTLQVAYKGDPLYTFAQDRQPGEAKGQGIKDVGTWSVVKTSSAGASSSTSAPPSTSGTPSTTAPSSEGSGGSGGGGGGGGYGY